MRRFFATWNIWKHIAFCLVATYIIGTIIEFSINHNHAASIGIIGGADGPTTIFVSGNVYPQISYIVLFIVAMLLFNPIKRLLSRLIQ